MKMHDTRNRMTDMTSATFTGKYQAMIIILNLVLAVVIALRFWALRKLRYRRWSARGVTDMFVVLTGFFAASYFAMYYACLVEDNKRIRGVREFWKLEQEFGTGSMPAMMKAREIKQYQTNVGLIRMVMRMVTLGMVWGVKFAFISIHYEFRHILPKVFGLLLHITSVIIGLSFIAFIITFVVATNRPAERAQGRHRFSIYSHNEYIIAGFDIFTDLLILILVTLVMRTLQLSRGDLLRSLPFQLAGILTIVISAARVVCKAVDDGYGMLILTLLEGYAAGVLLCLPAMRVWLRRWKRRDNTEVGSSKGNTDMQNLSGHHGDARLTDAEKKKMRKVWKGHGREFELRSEDAWVWDEGRQDVVRREPVYELE